MEKRGTQKGVGEKKILLRIPVFQQQRSLVKFDLSMDNFFSTNKSRHKKLRV
jgi:methionyl-tRNA synthetase